MSVDLRVVFEATVTAEEAFALPERLNSSPAIVAANRTYCVDMKTRDPHVGLCPWAWGERTPEVKTPSDITAAWAPGAWGSVLLSGTPGWLELWPDQIELTPFLTRAAFALDIDGCQSPVRRVCYALARALGTTRVLYLPDSGDWPAEVGELCDTRFDEGLARLTAWAPPVSAIGALAFGRAVRSGYHYADGALRRPDGTALTDDEIHPGYHWCHSGDKTFYRDGTPVPAEELARPDLRSGFAYYVDDFRDLM